MYAGIQPRQESSRVKIRWGKNWSAKDLEHGIKAKQNWASILELKITFHPNQSPNSLVNQIYGVDNPHLRYLLHIPTGRMVKKKQKTGSTWKQTFGLMYYLSKNYIYILIIFKMLTKWTISEENLILDRPCISSMKMDSILRIQPGLR